jgi:hypothetical protein
MLNGHFIPQPHSAASTSTTLRLSCLARAILEEGKSIRFRARGRSMFPCICDGDVITIAPILYPITAHGEIVACVSLDNQSLFVHRIIKKVPQGYLLRGDNLRWPDRICAAENIIGRVIKIERNGRVCSFGIGKESVVLALLSHMGALHRITAFGAKLLYWAAKRNNKKFIWI